MPAPRGNKNAAGKKRAERGSIHISLGVSQHNGLLDLLVEHLSRQGVEPTDENIRQYVRDWFYQSLGEQLKREIEDSEAMIL